MLVMCQYLRCTVTWTTQLSCPASLVAMHWYNPVLICVRFFSRTCPGLEMSEMGKTTLGLIKKKKKRLRNLNRTQKHKLSLWIKSVQWCCTKYQQKNKQTSPLRVEHGTTSSCRERHWHCHQATPLKKQTHGCACVRACGRSSGCQQRKWPDLLTLDVGGRCSALSSSSFMRCHR